MGMKCRIRWEKEKIKEGPDAYDGDYEKFKEDKCQS